MRNVIAFVLAIGIVVAIFWLTRDKDTAKPPAPSVASGSASSSVPGAKIDTSRVRRLDKAARKQLGEQIAAARAKARASTPSSSSSTPSSTGGTPPALPDDVMKLEDVAAPLQAQLKETIPILAECYADQQGLREALAQMTLTSDPELGTVIDTEAIKGADGQPLATKLDECLRDVIDSLALPPLGDKGGKLPLQYTFKFD